MSKFIWNIFMEGFPWVMVCASFGVWVYLFIQNIKSLKHFKDKTGKNIWFLYTISRERERILPPIFEEAYERHKKNSKRFMLIWVCSLVIIFITSILFCIISTMLTR